MLVLKSIFPLFIYLFFYKFNNYKGEKLFIHRIFLLKILKHTNCATTIYQHVFYIPIKPFVNFQHTTILETNIHICPSISLIRAFSPYDSFIIYSSFKLRQAWMSRQKFPLPHLARCSQWPTALILSISMDESRNLPTTSPLGFKPHQNP